MIQWMISPSQPMVAPSRPKVWVSRHLKFSGSTSHGGHSANGEILELFFQTGLDGKVCFTQMWEKTQKIVIESWKGWDFVWQMGWGTSPIRMRL